MKNRASYLCVLLFCVSLQVLAQDGQLKFANLGDFKLVSGESIRDCRIGYRTYGHLNADKSNVIVFTTWSTGTTEMLQGQAGAGRIADSSKYFVVMIDALANGVSSSPSNSLSQPRMQFPKITMRDMVATQYELVTRELQIHHVKAVVGISMGGMQTFQWIVSYPDFMDKAVTMVGSPRLAPYDLVLWKSEIDAIKKDPGWKDGNYTENPAGLQLAEFGALVSTTPRQYNREMSREKVFEALETEANKPGADANDHIRQMEAMMSLDVSDVFEHSMEKAAAVVKAKVLVVVGANDHVVTPQPAKDFAALIGAQVLEFNSDCGHQTPACEDQIVTAKATAFLQP